MSRKVRGVTLIVAGLIMVFGAVGVFAMYDRQDELAGRNAQILLSEMARVQTRIPAPLPVPEPEREEEAPAEMPVATYAGYDIAGVIRIPGVGVELPVLSQWNYDLLEIAPCRYSGSVEGRDLIILGHNYKSHFAPLKRVEPGSVAELEGVDGHKYLYTVEAVEKLHKTEVEKLPSPEHDLTIFTCTTGGQSRLVLRCSLYTDGKE